MFFVQHLQKRKSGRGQLMLGLARENVKENREKLEKQNPKTIWIHIDSLFVPFLFDFLNCSLFQKFRNN